jgi:hypothetical protein
MKKLLQFLKRFFRLAEPDSSTTPRLSDQDVDDYLEDLMNYHSRITNRRNLEETWHRIRYERQFKRFIRRYGRNLFDLSIEQGKIGFEHNLLQSRSSRLLKMNDIRYEFGPYSIEFGINSNYVSGYYSLNRGITFVKFSEQELRGTISDYSKVITSMMVDLEEVLKTSLHTNKPPIYPYLNKSSIAVSGYTEFI